MDSKREKIIQEIVGRMQTIQIANGFQTDIGNTVEDSRVEWDEEELPAISVFDLTERISEATPDEAVDILLLTVEIRGAVAADTRAADARKVIADILQAVKADHFWYEGTEKLALDTEYKQSSIVYDKDAFKIVGVSVVLEIHYYIKRFDYYG